MSDSKKPMVTLGMQKHDDGSVKLDGASLLASLGGVLGLVESAIPGLAFVATYAISQNTSLALYVASTIAIAFIVIQFLRKRPLTQAIFGLVGVFITMYLTLRNGTDAAHARDYYLSGFFTNIAYFSALLISILVRWPIIGVLVGVFTDGVQWRKRKGMIRRYSLITGIWIALFGLRLLVQVPLYLSNQVVALGFARLAMGVPLYALCAWLTWLAVRPLIRDLV